MDMTDIKKKVLKASIATHPFIIQLKKDLLDADKGFDRSLDSIYVPLIEKYCDKVGIPCHVISDNCMAFAPTYDDLYKHEKMR